MTTLSDDSVVVGLDEVVSCDLAGGAALLDLRSSTYFSVNGVGARVWSLMQQPIRVREIHQTLLVLYEVDPEKCRRDLLSLLASLNGAGLVNVLEAAD